MVVGRGVSPTSAKGSLEEIIPGRVVAIIDGELPPGAFLSACEIQAALERGVVLYGAASVGAYHASAFADHGMRGIGWVYDQFREGQLASLDEISLIYDPVSLGALSVPLVNIRFWLDGLVSACVIASEGAQAVLEEVPQLAVFDRNASMINRLVAQCLPPAASQRALEATQGTFPDVKADDARRLLRFLAGLREVETEAKSVNSFPEDTASITSEHWAWLHGLRCPIGRRAVR